MRRIALTLVLVCLGATTSVATAAYKVLSVNQTPETYESRYGSNRYGFMWIVDYMTRPSRTLHDDFDVERVMWHEAPEPLAHPGRYDAIILWDAPRKVHDKRGYDTFYRDIDLIPDATAKKLVEYVKNGGVLIMAGGMTCFGGAPEEFLKGDDVMNNDKVVRTYTYYGDGPLGEILPVTIPESPSIQNAYAGRGASPFIPLKVTKPCPMTEGLSWGDWTFGAIHRTEAKDGAEVLVELETGLPVLVRHAVGKGRVIALAASPKGYGIQPHRLPVFSLFWDEEPVLWDRMLRWGLGEPFGDKKREDALRQAQRDRVGPLPHPLPMEEVYKEYPFFTHAGKSTMPPVGYGPRMRLMRDLGINAGVEVRILPTFLHQFDEREDIKAKRLAKFPPIYDLIGDWGRSTNTYHFFHSSVSTPLLYDKVDPEAFAVVCQPGGKFAKHYSMDSPDPFAPLTKQYSIDYYLYPAKAVDPDDSVWAGIMYEDEWSYRYPFRHAYKPDPGVGGYSPFAKAYYKAMTGEDAPLPVWRKPGSVIPADDPWLRWAEVIRQDSFRDYNRGVRDAVKRLQPNWRLTNYPGGFSGVLDMVLDEIYLANWKSSPPCVWENVDSMAMWLEDPTRREHEYWALIAIFLMPDEKAVFPENFRLDVGACLARGVNGIGVWNSVNFVLEHHQHADRIPLIDEVRAIGTYLRRYGNMHNQLEVVPSPVWYHVSKHWRNSYDNFLLIPPPEGEMGKTFGTVPLSKEFQFNHVQIQEIGIPAALRGCVPVDCVTEKQLLSEDLMKQKAVLLPGLMYIRQDIVDNLQRFIAQGGKVYQDESAACRIPGAQILPVDLAGWHRFVAGGNRPIAFPAHKTWMEHTTVRENYIDEAIPVFRKHIADALDPEIRIDHPEGFHALQRNGSTRYLTVLNANLHGPETVTVKMKHPPAVLYDLVEAERVDASGGSFEVSLPGGGWKVFVMAEKELAKTTAAARIEGDRLIVEANVFGPDDTGWQGAVPIEITLTGADGRTTVVYDATSLGAMRREIRLARGVVTPASVTVRNLLTGETVKASM